jgi:hypothetical protein
LLLRRWAPVLGLDLLEDLDRREDVFELDAFRALAEFGFVGDA